MKKFVKVLGIFFSIFVIFGCVSPQPEEQIILPVEREVGVEYTLTLVHTNDHHGATLSKMENLVLQNGELS